MLDESGKSMVFWCGVGNHFAKEVRFDPPEFPQTSSTVTMCEVCVSRMDEDDRPTWDLLAPAVMSEPETCLVLLQFRQNDPYKPYDDFISLPCILPFGHAEKRHRVRDSEIEADFIVGDFNG